MCGVLAESWWVSVESVGLWDCSGRICFKEPTEFSFKCVCLYEVRCEGHSILFCLSLSISLCLALALGLSLMFVCLSFSPVTM